MSRGPVRSIVVLSLFVLAGCAGLIGCASNPPARRIWVAPRVDLKPYETIGMVEFTSTTKGALAAMATRRFEEAARRDQDMVRMVDIGPEREALASVNRPQ